MRYTHGTRIRVYILTKLITNFSDKFLCAKPLTILCIGPIPRHNIIDIKDNILFALVYLIIVGSK